MNVNIQYHEFNHLFNSETFVMLTRPGEICVDHIIENKHFILEANATKLLNMCYMRLLVYIFV